MALSSHGPLCMIPFAEPYMDDRPVKRRHIAPHREIHQLMEYLHRLVSLTRYRIGVAKLRFQKRGTS